MRGVCVFVFFLSSVGLLHAQNLVPNGSFEDHLHCPDNWNQVINNVVGWTVCGPESPDYFHSCRNTNDFSVPANWLGYQAAFDGEAYVGVGTYEANEWTFREFVCAPLSQSLQPGVPVNLSMRVAMGGPGSQVLAGPQWASRGIGMLLTTQPFEWPWPYIVYPNTAQLFLDEVLTDSVSWLLLNSTYVPDSAYSFVTIGNFFDDSLSTPVLVDSSTGWQAAYVFVDAVCIGLDANDCGHGVFIEDPYMVTGPVVTSSFTDQLVIERRGDDRIGYDIELFSLGGQLLGRANLSADQPKLVLSTEPLAPGVYVLSIRSPKSQPRSVRVLQLTQ